MNVIEDIEFLNVFGALSQKNRVQGLDSQCIKECVNSISTKIVTRIIFKCPLVFTLHLTLKLLLIHFGLEFQQCVPSAIRKYMDERRDMPAERNASITCPIHKKGDRKGCNNYRGGRLLSITYKILASTIRERLKPRMLSASFGHSNVVSCQESQPQTADIHIKENPRGCKGWQRMYHLKKFSLPSIRWVDITTKYARETLVSRTGEQQHQTQEVIGQAESD